MAAPLAATTAAEAASNFARDGLFWMRDVLSPSELDVLKSAAAENFADSGTLLLQQGIVAVRADNKICAKSARDGARFDCRQGANEEPMSTLLRHGGAASKLISCFSVFCRSIHRWSRSAKSWLALTIRGPT